MQPSNILAIKTLNTGWRDKDDVLLHACFQLLTDFVEQEMKVNQWVDWEYDENTRAAKNEIESLYEWWKQWLLKPPTSSFDEDEKERQEENAMLKRLIEVRSYMWT